MIVHRITTTVLLVVLAGCGSEPQPVPLAEAATTYPGDPPTDCEWLANQYASQGDGLTFQGWLERNWASHRFTYCATGALPPDPPLTVAEKRYCYNIAITHGHMSGSPAKRHDRAAWFDMDCGSFLGRLLPFGPLPPAEDSAYTAALAALGN